MADTFAFLALCAFLMSAAILDIRTGKVPNWLTLPSMGVGLLFWTLCGFLGAGIAAPDGVRQSGLDGAAFSFFASAFALAAGLLPAAAIFFLFRGLGGGDVKAMGVIGALSARGDVILHTTVYSLTLAVLISVIVMIRKGIVMKTIRKIFATLISAASGVKTDLNAETTRIPIAVAMFGGGVLAGAEHLIRIVTFPWTQH